MQILDRLEAISPTRMIGELVEAPIGPGVYEVRHADTGELIAFGHAGSVADAIGELKDQRQCRDVRQSLFHRSASIAASTSWNTAPARPPAAQKRRPPPSGCKALRQPYWQRRMALGTAAIRHQATFPPAVDIV